jgi:hypothetical protein
MKNYPKHLNTKEDYEYVKNNFPKKKWKKDFEALLNDTVWQVEKTLADKDAGTEDKTHRIIQTENERVQMKLVEDKNSKLRRLGFGKTEVQKMLKG